MDISTEDVRRLPEWSSSSSCWWFTLSEDPCHNFSHDLCRTLWITEGRFNTEDDLPIQTLGHIQHQCETLSEIHTLTHHRCWCIIHTELGHLISSRSDLWGMGPVSGYWGMGPDIRWQWSSTLQNCVSPASTSEKWYIYNSRWRRVEVDVHVS
jgi:hypothetical protein